MLLVLLIAIYVLSWRYTASAGYVSGDALLMSESEIKLFRGRVSTTIKAVDHVLPAPVGFHSFVHMSDLRSPFTPVDGATSLPLWPILILLSSVTGWLACRVMQDRRERFKGRCPTCGYDLADLPAIAGAKTCPECGKPRAFSTP